MFRAPLRRSMEGEGGGLVAIKTPCGNPGQQGEQTVGFGPARAAEPLVQPLEFAHVRRGVLPESRRRDFLACDVVGRRQTARRTKILPLVSAGEDSLEIKFTFPARPRESARREKPQTDSSAGLAAGLAR